MPKLKKKDLSGGLKITIDKFQCSADNLDLSSAKLKKNNKVAGIVVKLSSIEGLTGLKDRKLKKKEASYSDGVITIEGKNFSGKVEHSF